MYISFESALAGLDCCTVLVWWLVGYEILPRFHWLVLPALWLVDLNIDWETRRLHWILGNYGLTWPVGISPVFQTPLTVPLHSPNGREMPVVRSVQGDCETVYAGSYLLSALVLLQGLLCGLWIFTLRCYEERPYIITLMVYWIPGIGSWKILQWRRVSVMTSAITTNPMGILPDTQNCGCACAGNAGNVFPVTAGERSRHASRHVRHARAVMHFGIAN